MDDNKSQETLDTETSAMRAWLTSLEKVQPEPYTLAKKVLVDPSSRPCNCSYNLLRRVHK